MDGFSSGVHRQTGLMARVYGLLSLTLMVSAVASYYGMHSTLVAQHPWMVMIGAFVLLFTTQAASREPIIGVPMIFLFSAAMGAMVGPSIALYLKMPDGPTIVSEALGTTTVMFIGLSLYATLTRRDYSHIGGFLITGLIVGILVSLLNMFMLHLPALQSALAGVFALVFSGLIVFDTQRMMQSGGNAIQIVMGLYLDIINLFMALLQIFGGSRD